MLNLARKFLAESFFKNSASLIVNLAFGAMSGFGSVALLTHIFSKSEVGLSSTAASATSLVTMITQFGVTYTIPRYLPTAKNRATLINTILTAVTIATLFGSIIFLVLPSAKSLWALGGASFGITFVLACCLTATQTILTNILIADRAADKVAVLGVIPNVARLAAPPTLSFLGGLGAFISRMIADLFSVISSGMLLIRRGHRFRPSLDRETVHDVTKFSVGMYVASTIGGFPALVLPLIVLARVGPAQTAYWSVAMSIGSILFSISSMLTQALLPEVSLRPTERRSLLIRSARLSLGLVVPVLLIAFLFAPIGLALFGHAYASAAVTPLRWLIIAGFITILNYASGAILFIAKKSAMITIVNIIDAIVVLGLAAFWATNVTDVAIAWTIGDVFNTVFFGIFAFMALREVGGRWEALGGDTRAEAAVTAAYDAAELSATSQFRAIKALATLAQQQRTAQLYRPQHLTMTASEGLFSIAALHAAERNRQQLITDIASPQDGGLRNVPGATVSGPDLDGSVESHKRAFDVLFEMAERQQNESPMDPYKYWEEHGPRSTG